MNFTLSNSLSLHINLELIPAVVHKERTLEGKMSNRCQGADNCSGIAFALYELSSIVCSKTWLFCTFSLVPVDEPNCQKVEIHVSKVA